MVMLTTQIRPTAGAGCTRQHHWLGSLRASAASTPTGASGSCSPVRRERDAGGVKSAVAGVETGPSRGIRPSSAA